MVIFIITSRQSTKGTLRDRCEVKYKWYLANSFDFPCCYGVANQIIIEQPQFKVKEFIKYSCDREKDLIFGFSDKKSNKNERKSK